MPHPLRWIHCNAQHSHRELHWVVCCHEKRIWDWYIFDTPVVKRLNKFNPHNEGVPSTIHVIPTKFLSHTSLPLKLSENWRTNLLSKNHGKQPSTRHLFPNCIVLRKTSMKDSQKSPTYFLGWFLCKNIILFFLKREKGMGLYQKHTSQRK